MEPKFPNDIYTGRFWKEDFPRNCKMCPSWRTTTHDSGHHAVLKSHLPVVIHCMSRGSQWQNHKDKSRYFHCPPLPLKSIFKFSLKIKAPYKIINQTWLYCLDTSKYHILLILNSYFYQFQALVLTVLIALGSFQDQKNACIFLIFLFTGRTDSCTFSWWSGVGWGSGVSKAPQNRPIQLWLGRQGCVRNRKTLTIRFWAVASTQAAQHTVCPRFQSGVEKRQHYSLEIFKFKVTINNWIVLAIQTLGPMINY